MVGLLHLFHTWKPHLFLTLFQLALAGFLIFAQSIFSEGISALVLVVYEQIVATLLLCSLAFFLDKGKRPPLSFQILGWAFLLGLLQTTICQMLFTLSLQYVAATYQTIALNMISPLVFVLSVVFRLEEFKIGSFYGRAKLCGVVVSAGGAVEMAVWKGPEMMKTGTGFQAVGDGVIGGILIAAGVIGGSFFNLLAAFMTRRYPPLSSTALLSLFGTIQAAVITIFVVPSSSWKIGTDGVLEIVAILFGGIVVTGLTYYVQVWCIYEKGPVFAASFNPLVIVFSFILETAVLRDAAYLGSIVGAVLVVGGLYLLLWAKSKEGEKEVMVDGNIDSPLLIN